MKKQITSHLKNHKETEDKIIKLEKQLSTLKEESKKNKEELELQLQNEKKKVHVDDKEQKNKDLEISSLKSKLKKLESSVGKKDTKQYQDQIESKFL